MKHLLYLVLSLVVIAAIVPAASATDYNRYNLSAKPDLWMMPNTTYTVSQPYASSADALAACHSIDPTFLSTVSVAIHLSDTGYVFPNSTTTLISGTTNYCGNNYSNCSQSFNTATKKFARVGLGCFKGGDKFLYYYPVWQMDLYDLVDKDVDFTGTPLTGSAPLSVLFTAVNLTNTTGSSWSFGDGNITSSTANPISHIYQNQGIYAVRLDYYNISGVPMGVQKNNYITVGAPNATKTKWFQTIDGTNGNIVLNSSIQLNDIENSSWVNATGLINDGMSSITTLEGHHIDAYAQALGYSDADDLNLLNDGLPRSIMMWPTFAKNVSAGNVSLYVTVKDMDTKANIVGAQVIVSTPQGSQSTTTNAAGIAYFVVSNNTMCLVTASAQGLGYLAATTTINTGSANGGSAAAAATILLGKSTTVIPTYTVPTTLPGGGTPAPTVTILPGCEDTISAAGQEKCRAAQSNQGLSFLSGNLLGLIQICFVVTILYLLGIKLGK